MRDDARCVRFTPGSGSLLYASDTDACTRSSSDTMMRELRLL